MDVWEQINATLSIIAWPLVVGLSVLVVFREQVRSLLARITKGKVGGAEIVLAEAATRAVTEEGNQEIREITESGSATTSAAVTGRAETRIEVSGSARGAPSRPSGGPNGAEDAGTPASEPRFTREQVEGFIKIAAETGHRVGAVSGYKGEVDPKVRWTDDGVPEIVRWRRPMEWLNEVVALYNNEALATRRDDATPEARARLSRFMEFWKDYDPGQPPRDDPERQK